MTSAITRLKLLGDRADELTKYQADAELREEREREARKAREARKQAAPDWKKWVNDKIASTLVANTDVIVANGIASSGIMKEIGAFVGKIRQEEHEYVNRVHDKLVAADDKLREEFRVKLGRAPLAQDWAPGKVFYLGDVASHAGSTYQAKRDTCQPVTSADDWTLLAGRGRDAVSPRVCAAFDAWKSYGQLNIVEYDGSAFIAVRDLEPGTIPGEDGWQLIARSGQRGPSGDTGARGQRGARGPRGEAALSIVNWTLDRKRYVAIPTMSDGTAGAPLELRGLFEQFWYETQGWAAE